MANCLEITLWYPEDKFNALSTALEPAGSSVEEELGRVLTELYERLVPSEQRVEIAEKLAREEQRAACRILLQRADWDGAALAFTLCRL